MTLVIASIPTPLYGFKLRKFLLLVTQYVRFYTAQFGYFTDGEITFARDSG